MLSLVAFGAVLLLLSGCDDSDACDAWEVKIYDPNLNDYACVFPVEATKESQYWATRSAREEMDRLPFDPGKATYDAEGMLTHTAQEVQMRLQQGCDPGYGQTSGGCVPSDRDYDCPELHAMGIGDIPVVGSDWQRLDGPYDGSNPYEPDGVGCEWT